MSVREQNSAINNMIWQTKEIVQQIILLDLLEILRSWGWKERTNTKKEKLETESLTI